MLNSMASRTRRVRTIGVRLDEAEWAIVEARRNEDEHESISDVIRRLIAESNGHETVSVARQGRPPQSEAGRVGPAPHVSRIEVVEALQDTGPISPTVRRFYAIFQPTVDAKTRDARARGFVKVLLTRGVKLGAQGNGKLDGRVVEAVDVTHLAQCCQDVIENPPRDPMRAVPMVLERLAATYDDTKSARLETATDE